MSPQEIAAGLSAEERELIKMGDDLRLFLPFKETNILVGETIFKRGTLVKSSYQDFASLKDPVLSDMPAMKRLEGMGLTEAKGSDWVAYSTQDGTEWRWRRTPLGRAVAEALTEVKS